MTQTVEPDQAAKSVQLGASPLPLHRPRRWAAPIILQVVAMLGIGALLYPTTANWFAERAQQSEISGYNETVQALPSSERQQKLASAEAYNSKLPAGVLRDPYTNPDADADTAAYAAYRDTLSIADNGVIGELSYPSLSIDLPIYHGTGADVLAKGAGHLFGSSLPIGGSSTHAVLTSHSGLTNASLFTPLHQASVGDTFTISVLGETHYYQVQSTEVITPDQTDHLRIVNGQDLVTLITCTPIGINSHRLLVTAARIAAPDDSGLQTLAGHAGPGFPWWAVIFVTVSGAVAYILFVPSRRRRRTASTKEHQ